MRQQTIEPMEFLQIRIGGHGTVAVHVLGVVEKEGWRPSVVEIPGHCV